MSLEIIKPGINIDFVKIRRYAYTFSLSLILIGIVSLIYHGGPRYGIDFAGGTIVQAKFDQKVQIDQIKSGLNAIGIKGAAVQRFGEAANDEYLIRTAESLTTSAGFSERVASALEKSTGKKVEIRRVEMVGPKVGATLRQKALEAIFFALLLITIYISGRFEMKWGIAAFMSGLLIALMYLLSIFSVPLSIMIIVALVLSLLLFWQFRLRFAMGAIVALIHDVTITVGIFSLLNKEFSLQTVAAVLTIIGYSLNDTIIVFDRIRENANRYSRRPLAVNINRSINETLSRTILTSGTVVIVLLALFFLGGDIIHDFSFAMLIGVFIGTYSSIYVASPILMSFEGKSEPKDQGQEKKKVATQSSS